MLVSVSASESVAKSASLSASEFVSIDLLALIKEYSLDSILKSSKCWAKYWSGKKDIFIVDNCTINFKNCTINFNSLDNLNLEISFQSL